MSSTPNSPDTLLRTLGLILLALGLVVLGWVFWNVYLLWTEPRTIGLLRDLAPTGDLFAAFSDANRGEVKLSTKFLEYSNVGLAVAILWISAGIGKSLVWSGSRLVGYRGRPYV